LQTQNKVEKLQAELKKVNKGNQTLSKQIYLLMDLKNRFFNDSEKYKKALEFYADTGGTLLDGGDIAREALK